MLILSDGEDNASRADHDAAEIALLKASIRVYAIGRHFDPSVGPRQSDRGPQALKKFAEATGGKVYFPKKENDFNLALTDIADDLTNVFAVTYTPPVKKPNGQLHKLEVRSRKKEISITAPDRLTD
jgi:Ca-activated chloride channel homolog